MKYDPQEDMLQESPDFLNGDSDILKSIAGNVREMAGSWDAVWDNIQLRAKLKQTLVDTATKIRNDSILEADFVIEANDQYHKISSQVRDEVGSLDPKRIDFMWHEWLKKHLKRMKL